MKGRYASALDGNRIREVKRKVALLTRQQRMVNIHRLEPKKEQPAAAWQPPSEKLRQDKEDMAKMILAVKTKNAIKAYKNRG